MARFVHRLGIVGVAATFWLAASAVHAVTVSDTSVADFNAGTPGACYVAETDDGEVLLSPAVGAEFDGPSLPAGWGSKDWPFDGSTTNGSATFTSGTLILGGPAS